MWTLTEHIYISSWTLKVWLTVHTLHLQGQNNCRL